MRKDTILVTGANGQIGLVLTKALREIYGNAQVIATDIRPTSNTDGPFEILDILDGEKLNTLVKYHKVTQIYHLAAILSAKGESNPLLTWKINMDGFFNVMECAKNQQLDKVFFPSSIAVFSPLSPKTNTPQHTILHPTSVYGISKSAGEDWMQYYFQHFGVDVRSLRYPGIIGYQSLPGGGTTDYAVDIFHYALRNEPYSCFLKEDTALPMIYMSDAIKATLTLMDAPAEQLSIRTSYNLSGMSFTPAEIASEIKKIIPDFRISYEPDFRQKIADSWPASIDDHLARQDWGWQEGYNLARMTQDMIVQLQKNESYKLVQA